MANDVFQTQPTREEMEGLKDEVSRAIVGERKKGQAVENSFQNDFMRQLVHKKDGPMFKFEEDCPYKAE